MILSATAASTETYSKQLSHTYEASNFFSHRRNLLISQMEPHWVPLQRVLSYWVLHPEKYLGVQEGGQLVPCTFSSSVLTLVLRRHMLGCLQADCSQLTHILEQQGIRQRSGGLPSPSLLAGFPESQHKPAIGWGLLSSLRSSFTLAKVLKVAL